MKKVDNTFAKVLATIITILVALIVIYFATDPNVFNGTWNHTYFLGSVLFFGIAGLIGFFIQKRNKKQKIGRLPYKPNHSVYRRSSGGIFLKLNDSYHVKTKKVGNRWIGDGITEKFDPKEKVKVIQ